MTASEKRERAAFNRLFKRSSSHASAPSRTSQYPRKVMEITGGRIPGIARIVFEQKYGVWFWTHCDSNFHANDLAQWGDTTIAIERMCKRMGYNFQWVMPHSEHGMSRTPQNATDKSEGTNPAKNGTTNRQRLAADGGNDTVAIVASLSLQTGSSTQRAASVKEGQSTDRLQSKVANGSVTDAMVPTAGGTPASIASDRIN